MLLAYIESLGNPSFSDRTYCTKNFHEVPAPADPYACLDLRDRPRSDQHGTIFPVIVLHSTYASLNRNWQIFQEYAPFAITMPMPLHIPGSFPFLSGVHPIHWCNMLYSDLNMPYSGSDNHENTTLSQALSFQTVLLPRSDQP